ncbi:hypothetical protein PR048_004356 [Dryococelus australis]|uniref:Transposase n=1 Tax=Dryococelus australis TaxID=614101 RepID=A0ABQ9I5P2_9NEOP|nr:hypothetical protein PR048_004356 [Dryococelus australis]
MSRDTMRPQLRRCLRARGYQHRFSFNVWAGYYRYLVDITLAARQDVWFRCGVAPTHSAAVVRRQLDDTYHASGLAVGGQWNDHRVHQISLSPGPLFVASSDVSGTSARKSAPVA